MARRQARPRELDPQGTHLRDDHLEVDYLIPLGSVCAVGEITARGTPQDAEKKYRRFARAFHFLETVVARLPSQRLAERNRFWSLLGVPPDRLREFRKVRELRGFVITPELERYDVQFDPSERLAVFYRADWKRLGEYAEAIAEYGRPVFLHALGHSDPNAASMVKVGRGTPYPLFRAQSRKIAGESIALADVYTFEVSPYDLLPAARVFRRDELPDLGGGAQNYQRPLRKEKLRQIRQNLLTSPDFMFPGNVLLVLGPDAEFRDDALIISKQYGAISVIDGQHRLFSYAEEAIEAIQGSDARIAAMAMKFETDDPAEIERYSAQIFIEINTNQTPVAPAHLYAIEYPILRRTTARALAAQMLIRLNDRHGALYGILDANQNNVGIIQPLTLLSTLRAYLNPDRVRSVAEAQRGDKLRRRSGYEHILDVTNLGELAGNPENFIAQGAASVGRFFDEVKKAFPHDFPTRDQRSPRSALRHAKFFAGFIRLLQQLTDEGCGWKEVRTELSAIRRNVLLARCVGANTRIVFADSSPQVPDATFRVGQIFRFLNANRSSPKTASEVA